MSYYNLAEIMLVLLTKWGEFRLKLALTNRTQKTYLYEPYKSSMYLVSNQYLDSSFAFRPLGI